MWPLEKLKQMSREASKWIDRKVTDALDGNPSNMKQFSRSFEDGVDTAQNMFGKAKNKASEFLENKGLRDKPWYKKIWDELVKGCNEIAEFVKGLFETKTGEYNFENDSRHTQKHTRNTQRNAERQLRHDQIRGKHGIGTKSASEPDLTKGNGAADTAHKRSNSDGDIPRVYEQKQNGGGVNNLLKASESFKPSAEVFAGHRGSRDNSSDRVGNREGGKKPNHQNMEQISDVAGQFQKRAKRPSFLERLLNSGNKGKSADRTPGA